MSTIVQTPNAEAIAAWDGPLYDRFVQFRKIVTEQSERLLAVNAQTYTSRSVTRSHPGSPT